MIIRILVVIAILCGCAAAQTGFGYILRSDQELTPSAGAVAYDFVTWAGLTKGDNFLTQTAYGSYTFGPDYFRLWQLGNGCAKCRYTADSITWGNLTQSSPICTRQSAIMVGTFKNWLPNKHGKLIERDYPGVTGYYSQDVCSVGGSNWMAGGNVILLLTTENR